ncbi:MAG: uracil-DNA glycosylase [Candidatus Dormibacteria bacterium]
MHQVDALLTHESSSLVEEITSCTACALCTTRTNAVPGDGPLDASVMVIGEAPGKTEDQTGHPFVGAAGNLLNSLLGGIGLSRSTVFITNIVKCRPPGNRDPHDEDVAACASFLDRQIALIKPDVILLLGRHALHRLIPDAPSIATAHGTVLTRGDRTYIPLYHPAAALYNGSLLATLRNDMEVVKSVLEERASSSPKEHVTRTGSLPVEQLSLTWNKEEHA